MSLLAANSLSSIFATHKAAGAPDHGGAGATGIEALFAALLETSVAAPPGEAVKEKLIQGSAPKSDKPLADPRDGSSVAALIAAAPAIFPAPVSSVPRARPDSSMGEDASLTPQAAAKSVPLPRPPIASAAVDAAAGTRPKTNPLLPLVLDRGSEAMDAAVSAGDFAWPEPQSDLRGELPQPNVSMNPTTLPMPAAKTAAAPLALPPSAHIASLKQPSAAANPAARVAHADVSAVAQPPVSPAGEMPTKSPALSVQIPHSEIETRAASEFRPSPVPDWFVEPSPRDVAPNVGSATPRANPIPVRVVAPAAARTPTSPARPQDLVPKVHEPVPGTLPKPAVLHLDRVFEPSSAPAPAEKIDRNPQIAADDRLEMPAPREAKPSTSSERPSVKPAPNVAVPSDSTAAPRAMPLPGAGSKAEPAKFMREDSASNPMPSPGAVIKAEPAKFARTDTASRSMPLAGTVTETEPAKIEPADTASKSMPFPGAATEAASKKSARLDAPTKENIGTASHDPKAALRKTPEAPLKIERDVHDLAPESRPTSQSAPQPDRLIVKHDDPAPAAARSEGPSQPIQAAQPNPAPQPVAASTDTVPSSAAIAPAAAPAVATKPDSASPPASAATPHATASPSLPHADLGAIAVKIAAKSRDGDRHFDIRLDPPELGRIDVHLYVDQSGRAQAHLAADKPHTLALLQRDSAELQRGLKEAGLELSNNGLNFSLKGQEHRDAAPQPAPRPRAFAEAPCEAPVPARASPQSSSAANGRLDIRI